MFYVSGLNLRLHDESGSCSLLKQTVLSEKYLFIGPKNEQVDLLYRGKLMNIGDPRELYKIDGFAQDFIKSCQNNCINHQKFIGPDDRFAFACERTNVCCKNFSEEDRIVLEPYDVLRLSRRFNISTQRILHDFAELALDENTHFPIAFLTYKGKSRKNKCWMSPIKARIN